MPAPPGRSASAPTSTAPQLSYTVTGRAKGRSPAASRPASRSSSSTNPARWRAMTWPPARWSTRSAPSSPARSSSTVSTPRTSASGSTPSRPKPRATSTCADCSASTIRCAPGSRRCASPCASPVPKRDERYAELHAAVDAHCPVLDLFANATPVTVTLVRQLGVRAARSALEFGPVGVALDHDHCGTRGA